MLGDDIPEARRATIWTYNKATGKPEDETANLATLASEPKTSLTAIQLYKAIALNILDLENLITAMKATIEGIAINVIDIETRLGTIETTAGEILDRLDQTAIATTNTGTGTATLTGGAAKLAWIGWSVNVPNNPYLSLDVNGAVVQVSNQPSGFWQFSPPIEAATYALTLANGGTGQAIVNLGKI